jgi:hypothetical protein
MNDSSRLLYILFGVINLLIAVFFTLGAAFSSYGVSVLVALLVDLPLALGLMAAIEPRKPFSLLMMFGCTMTIIYIAVASYFRVKSGFSFLPFHVTWATVSVVEMALAFNRFRKQRSNGVMTWPH